MLVMLGNSVVRWWGAKRSAFTLVSACAVVLFTFYFLLSGNLSFHPSIVSSRAQNDTLGFGGIYVLTENDTTWRIQGLRQAAKFIKLRLTVPIERHASDEEVETYLAGDEPTAAPRDIRAAINYISLLERFLLSGYETALFFEDDVDFDVNIKSQMEIISQLMLSFSLEKERIDGEDLTTDAMQEETAKYPYGRDMWDLFWIGHYGVEFTTESQVMAYTDPHALPWDHLTSNYNNYYELLRSENELQPKEQQKQRLLLGAAPMGTYAFALSRTIAQSLVRELRDIRVQQFDLALHIDCKGLKYKCVAPVPALMHHHRVIDDGAGHPGKNNLIWWRNRHKYTYNVKWSARCNAAKVGERLGERWQCLPSRYDDNE